MIFIYTKDMEINLETLGYRDFFKVGNKKGLDIARVAEDTSDGYLVINEAGQFAAGLSGDLQVIAAAPADFPVVGDWVLISRDEEKAIIHNILPRQCLLERWGATEEDQRQVLGANLDTAFIMIPLDGEFDIDPIEHYLAMVNMGRIRLVILILFPVFLVPLNNLLDNIRIQQGSGIPEL